MRSGLDGRLGRPIRLARSRDLCLIVAHCVPSGPWMGEKKGDDAASAGPLELTLDDAVRLALRDNRGLVAAGLARVEEKLSLDIAGDRYRPRVSVEVATSAKWGRETAYVDVGPGLRIPTGGSSG